MKPFFSVIITTFNRPKLLCRAIESVLNQEFENFELIIVNDGSIVPYDQVLTYIEGNTKIKYFYKENEERSIARNFAFEKASGTWICFLDDDDIYYKNHLYSLYNKINHLKNDDFLIYTRTIKRFKDGSTEKIEIPQKKHNGIDVLLYDLFTVNGVCIPYKVTKTYFFDVKLKYLEDFEYWLRLIISANLNVISVDEYTNEYIFHDTNSVNWSYESRSEKLKTILFLREKYSNVLPKWFYNTNITSLCTTMVEYESINNKKKCFKNLYRLILANPIFIFKRHFLGILKNLLFS